MSIIGVTQYVVPAISAQPLKGPETVPRNDNASVRQTSNERPVSAIGAMGLANDTKQPHAAPPSVLQLKILALLKEQEEAKLLRDSAEPPGANGSNQRADERSAVGPTSNALDDLPMSPTPYPDSVADPTLTDVVIPALSTETSAQKAMAADQGQWHLTETAPLATRDLRPVQAR